MTAKKETWKERTERELEEKLMEMRGGPEVDDIAAKFEKLRTDYHKKCDEVIIERERLVASRENERKAREERDAALVKISKIKEWAETHRNYFVKDFVKDAKASLLALVGPDPLTPQKGPAATRST